MFASRALAALLVGLISLSGLAAPADEEGLALSRSQHSVAPFKTLDADATSDDSCVSRCSSG